MSIALDDRPQVNAAIQAEFREAQRLRATKTDRYAATSGDPLYSSRALELLAEQPRPAYFAKEIMPRLGKLRYLMGKDIAAQNFFQNRILACRLGGDQGAIGAQCPVTGYQPMVSAMASFDARLACDDGEMFPLLKKLIENSFAEDHYRTWPKTRNNQVEFVLDGRRATIEELQKFAGELDKEIAIQAGKKADRDVTKAAAQIAEITGLYKTSGRELTTADVVRKIVDLLPEQTAALRIAAEAAAKNGGLSK